MTFSGKRYRITPSTAKKATEYPNARWTREKRPGCKRLQNGVGEDSAGAAGGDAYGTLPVPLECQRAESSAEIGWHHEAFVRSRPNPRGRRARFFTLLPRARRSCPRYPVLKGVVFDVPAPKTSPCPPGIRPVSQAPPSPQGRIIVMPGPRPHGNTPKHNFITERIFDL